VSTTPTRARHSLVSPYTKSAETPRHSQQGRSLRKRVARATTRPSGAGQAQPPLASPGKEVTRTAASAHRPLSARATSARTARPQFDPDQGAVNHLLIAVWWIRPAILGLAPSAPGRTVRCRSNPRPTLSRIVGPRKTFRQELRREAPRPRRSRSPPASGRRGAVIAALNRDVRLEHRGTRGGDRRSSSANRRMTQGTRSAGRWTSSSTRNRERSAHSRRGRPRCAALLRGSTAAGAHLEVVRRRVGVTVSAVRQLASRALKRLAKARFAGL